MKHNPTSTDAPRRLLRACWLAPLLLSGCVERTVAQDTVTYHFAWWVMASMIAGGGTAIWASRFVPNRTDGWYRFVRKIRFGLVSSGVMTIFVTMVMYFQDVTVSADGFTEKVGFFGQKVHQVKYRDLERVELVKEVSASGRRSTTNYYFICFAKNGSSDKVPLSGTCMQAALPEILKALQSASIPIVDRTGNAQ